MAASENKGTDPDDVLDGAKVICFAEYASKHPIRVQALKDASKIMNSDGMPKYTNPSPSIAFLRYLILSDVAIMNNTNQEESKAAKVRLPEIFHQFDVVTCYLKTPKGDMEKISAFKRKADIDSDIKKVKSMKHFTSLYGGSIDEETVYILEEPADQEKPGEKQAFDGMLWEAMLVRNYIPFGQSAHKSVPDAGDTAFFLENCRVKISQVENATSSRVPRVILYGHNMDMHKTEYPRTSLPSRNFFRAEALKKNRIFFLVGVSGNDEQKLYHFGQMAHGKATDDPDNISRSSANILPTFFCWMVDCTSDLVKRLKFSYLQIMSNFPRTAGVLPGEIPERKRKAEQIESGEEVFAKMLKKNTSRFKVK